MEKKTKRRVLSLSLSQSVKQQKNLSKLKRHMSASSDKEIKPSVSENSHQSNSTRDHCKDIVSKCNTFSDTKEGSRSKPVCNSPSSEVIQDEVWDSSALDPDPNRTDRKYPDKSPPEHRLGRSQSQVKDKHFSLGYGTKLSKVVSSIESTNLEDSCNKITIENLNDIAASVPKEIFFQGHSGKPNKQIPVDPPTVRSEQDDSDEDFQINKRGASVKADDTVQSASNEEPNHTEIELSNAGKTSENCHLEHGSTEINGGSATSVKSDESTEILQCPLCYKNFDKMVSKTSHLKGCAAKHKMTTQQLLDALELQKRQIAERRALGLPGIRQSIKKSAVTKRENRAVSKMDSGLQLAMALSLSLQDQEQSLENALKGETTREVSLDHFGFSHKPVLDGIQPRPPSSTSRGKDKGKSKRVPTLLIRTEEERQQIITEKVAMVLLEEVELGRTSSSEAGSPQSALLRKYQDKKSLLWVKSCISPRKDDRVSYYVDNLRGFISPSKVEMGSKIMHLSQVAGRVKTPTKVGKPHDIIEIASASHSDEEVSSDSHSPNQSTNPSAIEMELRAKLFNDWAGMVNNSCMSDLAIYPQEGREIPAHKIILQVRCPRILHDISRQRNILTGNEVEVIIWSKTPHAAALAFLEYVYCGSVKSIRALSEDLSNILGLAKHYKSSDLLRYLKAVAENMLICETPSQLALNAISDINNHITPSILDNKCDKGNLKELNREELIHDQAQNLRLEFKSAFPRKLSRNSLDLFASPSGTPTRSESESIYSEATLPGTDHRSVCSSPDMFCDDEVINESEGVEGKDTKYDKMIEQEKHCESVMTLSDGMSSSSPKQNFCVNSKINEHDGNISRPSSQCASISSDKTVVLGRTSPAPSPVSSNASAVTEVLDMNEAEPREYHLSLTDSKRKLSNASQEESCKRLRSISPNPQHVQPEDVEFLDLTQDSNSSSSVLAITGKFSGESGNKVTISSESDIFEDNSNHEDFPDNDERKSQDVKISPTCHAHPLSKDIIQESNADKNVEEEDLAPYISPVWDGFEDLNYDDPFFAPLPTNSDSPGEKRENKKAESPEAKSHSSSCDKEVPDQNSDFGHGSPGVSYGKFATLKSKVVGSGSSSDTEIPSYQTPSSVLSNPGFNRSTRLEALLDDSLEINDSILQQAERGAQGKLTQRETKGTPLNRILSAEPDGVTPLANYSAMKTPELKRELQKFGLKPSLGKRKGKIMLRHIYNELHPWVPADESLKDGDALSQPTISNSNETEKFLSLSQPSNSRKLTFSVKSTSDSDTMEDDSDIVRKKHGRNESDSNDSESSENATSQEAKFLEDDADDNTFEPLSQASSQAVSGANLPTVVSEFIMSDSDFHQKVLEYEPVWIEQLQKDLRNNGFKFKMQDLMAFLDEKCITFRTAQSGPRTKKRRQKCVLSKKKTAKEPDGNELSE